MYMGIEDMKDADIKRGSATGDGNTVFALGWTPPSEQSLWVTINGVTQQDSAYTVSGSNITFATAPTTGDAIEFRGVQSSGTVVTPADGSVSAAKMATEAVGTTSLVDNAVTGAKIAALTVDTAQIAANAVDGTKIAMGSDAAGDILTYTGTDYVRLPKGTASQTLKMNSGASAVEWATVAAGGDNSPSFRATNGSNQNISHDTWTKLAADTENWDTDTAYDNSTYRFTVPAGEGGKYLFFYGAYFEGGLGQDKAAEVSLYINNVNDNRCIMRTGASDLADSRIHGMSFPIALVATDYVECFLRQHGGSTSTCLANFAYFGGMKLIGI